MIGAIYRSTLRGAHITRADNSEVEGLRGLYFFEIALAHKHHELAVHAEHNQLVQCGIIKKSPAFGHDQVDSRNDALGKTLSIQRANFTVAAASKERDETEFTAIGIFFLEDVNINNPDVQFHASEM